MLFVLSEVLNLVLGPSFDLPLFYFHGLFPSVSFAAAAANLLQSCPTLCDPIDGSPLDSSVPGILQARVLEWVAIAFSPSLPTWPQIIPPSSCLQILAPQGPRGSNSREKDLDLPSPANAQLTVLMSFC